ncbi:BLUF domain-containing protein [Cognatishimia sp. 1_MG-2023]|uniref:BLUF domain-containing protein n=1 Tax=Cognatishimia sp. 1_MG-2023 TaxID=3062642 RepID=UPI0026E15D1D|nr:BLUF domain-containing protein [Cognatishimia sp. 1_MG-2023]MDO6726377.1 BLUF domain-containing protein [Cognatishimia sp. 1_MG-2023]
MIYRIIYFSTAAHAMASEDLEALMQLARANNQRVGITGLVAYHDFTFIQVLEGPRSAVQACFDRISGNTLHRNVTLAWRGEALERCFEKYSMAFVPAADQTPPQNQAFKDLRAVFDPENPTSVASDKIVTGFFEAFRDTTRPV